MFSTFPSCFQILRCVLSQCNRRPRLLFNHNHNKAEYNEATRTRPTIKKGIAIAANLTFALWMETVTLKMSSTRLRSPLQPRRKHTSDFVALLSN